MEETDLMLIWGTWEELVLGGAVLRHGTRSWDAVAEELRSRAFYSYFFTPEVCKAKYKELQERYSGCNSAWFEELRKQRVAQLKLELEKSDGSIGSLESKLESLKSKNPEGQNGNYTSVHTESPPSVGNLARINFPLKETSKDGLSAGSFTQETQTDSSPACQIPTVASNQENQLKTEEGENATSKENIVRKRRGKRKRKECVSEVFEGIVRQNESMGDCNRAFRSSNDDDKKDQTGRDENIDLMGVLNSIVESENLAVFQKRTDSQRRGKYKKMIRRHMDLNLMRSGISDGSIGSAKELYRDLLLLCNNAIIFYSKESREYKSAISLRDYVTKSFWHNLRGFVIYSGGGGGGFVVPPEKPACNPLPPVKPRSIRPSNHKVAEKDITDDIPIRELKKASHAELPVEATEVVAKKRKIFTEDVPMVQESKKACNAELPTEPTEAVAKKRVDRPVKVGRSGGSKRVETPVNGRKRPRKR